jgi:hypothetical protein
MNLPRLLFIAGVAALSACNLSSDLPTSRPIGIVLITDTTDLHGNSAVSPVGHFFQGSGVVVPDSRQVQDSCVVIPNLADTGAFPYGQFTGVDAGAAITVQTTQATTNVPVVVDSIVGQVTGFYMLPRDSVIPFTPGTPVTVTVPGATGGFPSFAVSAATAAPYTVGPIDTVPAADSFHINWAPPAGAGSAMVFAISFDTASTTGNPVAVELYCSETDTGDALVPTGVTQAWLKALPGSRSMRSYRWQTTIQNGDSVGLIIIAQHNEYFPHIP